MSNRYTEVTRTSWFSRLGGAFKGILTGIILFLVAFPLLFWNEGRAVATYQALLEGAGIVRSVEVDRVNPANEGALIHIRGQATTTETLTDPTFGVSVNALRLARKVEMFQWQEQSETRTTINVGGSETRETVYTYTQGWSEQRIDSSRFNQPQYQNPPSMPYSSQRFTAQQATLGAFSLSSGTVERISGFAPLPSDAVPDVPETLIGRAVQTEHGYYIGFNPHSPQIGDVRISFEQVQPTLISLIARQSGHSFEAYRTSNNRELFMLYTGSRSAEQMFEQAQADNVTLTWLLRALGLFLMMTGIGMILKPISVLLDVLPFLGRISRGMMSLVGLLIALPLTLVTIAIAWLFYRPLLAVVLLTAAVAVGFAAVALLRRLRKRSDDAPAAVV